MQNISQEQLNVDIFSSHGQSTLDQEEPQGWEHPLSVFAGNIRTSEQNVRLVGKSKPNIAISISMPTTGLKSRILHVRAAETHYWTLGIKPNRWKISVCLLDIIKKCWPISWFLCWKIMICESYEDVIYCVCFKLRVRTVNDLL